MVKLQVVFVYLESICEIVMGKPDPIQNLVKCLDLAWLPGIREKTATRLALYIINRPKERAVALAQSITKAREKIRFCSQCFNYTKKELCFI